MEILCKLSLHRWRYHTRKIPINISGSQIIDLSINLRTCKKCMRREISNGNWKKIDLYTKDEKREIRLKSLLGKAG